jgi:putative spermidine/putrescine transport system ATP-binding protein
MARTREVIGRVIGPWLSLQSNGGPTDCAARGFSRPAAGEQGNVMVGRQNVGSRAIGTAREISLSKTISTSVAPRSSVGQSLTIEHITHRYGPALAVRDVTLEIMAGELVALLGPSGCGKTTLLRVIAGFIAQTEGRIVVGGKAIDDLSASRRAVGIVFQNYALFPHMSVVQNIAYGLAAKGKSRAQQKARVAEMLSLVKMEEFADRYPRQLSGGQQQRVAVARALAVEPSLLLLDEPFAALDKNLRLDMQIEVKRIQRLAGTTTILVTHDQEEALSMADRVAVLNHGRLEQFAAPTEIYDNPRSLFVNTFVGTSNILNGLMSGPGSQPVVTLDSGEQLRTRAAAEPIGAGQHVVACVRPEHLRFATDGIGIAGIIEMSLPLGSAIVHEVRTPSGMSLKVSERRSAGGETLAPGAAVIVQPISPDFVNVFRDTSAP